MDHYSHNNKMKGQGMAEYALIMEIVAVTMIAVMAVIGPTIGNVFSKINSNLTTLGSDHGFPTSIPDSESTDNPEQTPTQPPTSTPTATPTPTDTPTPTYTPTPTETLTPIPSPTPQNWIFCANENYTCDFAGPATVAYGANGTFYYQEFSDGPVACSNGQFGDPLYGVYKACYYSQ